MPLEPASIMKSMQRFWLARSSSPASVKVVGRDGKHALVAWPRDCVTYRNPPRVHVSSARTLGLLHGGRNAARVQRSLGPTRSVARGQGRRHSLSAEGAVIPLLPREFCRNNLIG